ncbi:MAG: P-II family nitrogen regulator [Syntrophobacteraceae bacterium]
MEIKKIIAIIRNLVLKDVEKHLRELGVKGITVSRVKGHGEHKEYLTRNWLSEQSRIEIFASKDKIDAIVAAILESAHTGLKGDGLIAVLPVERIFRIKTKAEALPSEI